MGNSHDRKSRGSNEGYYATNDKPSTSVQGRGSSKLGRRSNMSHRHSSVLNPPQLAEVGVSHSAVETMNRRWDCDVCGCNNDPSLDECLGCQTSKFSVARRSEL